MQSYLYSIAFWLCLHSISHAQSLSGDTWKSASTTKTGEIKIIHVESDPFTTSDRSTGELKGICFDILNDFIAYVKQEKGVTISPEYVANSDFYKMYETIENSSTGVMAIGDILVLDKKKETVQYTNIFLKSGITLLLITNSNVPTLASKDDIPKVFADFKAYTIKGTLSEIHVMAIKRDLLPALEIIYVKEDELLSRLESDPASFGYISLSQLFGSRGVSIKNHKAGKIIKGDLAFMLPKDSDWAGIFNEFLSANGGYTKSEQFKKTLVRHMGESGYRLLMSLQR